MTYEEKQARKLERYQELVIKSENASDTAYEQSHRISEMIPFGQPILVGHHSEGRHRRDIDRIHNLMGKSIELKEKSEYYSNKVDNLLNSTSISSDDPEAINKLKEKLVRLEEERIKIKARPHQAYELPNLSGNIRQVKQRIESLERQSKIIEIEETVNGITLKIDKEDNRVKLMFPSIPSEEVRSKLKQNGFRWSPYNKAWQRQINDWSIHLAKEFQNGNQ